MKVLTLYSVLLLTCLIAAHPVKAQEFPWGTETGVSLQTNTQLYLDPTAFAVDQAGNSCMAWKVTTDSTLELRAQAFSPENQPLWGDQGLLLRSQAHWNEVGLHSLRDGSWIIVVERDRNLSIDEPPSGIAGIIRISAAGTIEWEREVGIPEGHGEVSLVQSWTTAANDLCTLFLIEEYPIPFYSAYVVQMIDEDGNLPWGHEGFNTGSIQPGPDDQGRVVLFESFTHPEPYQLLQIYDRDRQPILGEGVIPEGIRFEGRKLGSLFRDGFNGFYSYSRLGDRVDLHHFQLHDNGNISTTSIESIPFDFNSIGMQVGDGRAILRGIPTNFNSGDTVWAVHVWPFERRGEALVPSWPEATEIVYARPAPGGSYGSSFGGNGGVHFFTAESYDRTRNLRRIGPDGLLVDEHVDMPATFHTTARMITRGDTLHLAWQGETIHERGIWKGSIDLSQMAWIGYPVRVTSAGSGKVIKGSSRILGDTLYTALLEVLTDSVLTVQPFVTATDVESGTSCWEAPRAVGGRTRVESRSNINPTLEWIDDPRELYLTWSVSNEFSRGVRYRRHAVQRLDREGRPLWNEGGVEVLGIRNFHSLSQTREVVTASIEPGTGNLVMVFLQDGSEEYWDETFTSIGINPDGERLGGVETLPGIDRGDTILGLEPLSDGSLLMVAEVETYAPMLHLYRFANDGELIWEQPRTLDYYYHGEQEGLDFRRLQGELTVFRQLAGSEPGEKLLQQCVIDEETIDTFHADDNWVTLFGNGVDYQNLSVAETSEGGFWLSVTPSFTSLLTQRYDSEGELVVEWIEETGPQWFLNQEFGRRLVGAGPSGSYQAWSGQMDFGILMWRYNQVEEQGYRNGMPFLPLQVGTWIKLEDFLSDGEEGVILTWLNDPGNYYPAGRNGGYYALRFQREGLLNANDSRENSPESYSLASPFPNPFNPSTTVTVQVPVAGEIRLAVYDLLGREVACLVDGVAHPGQHTFSWNGVTSSGSPVATGVYFVRFSHPDGQTMRKIVLMK